MKTLISSLSALSLALIATPVLAQGTQLSPQQASNALKAEAGYVSAMRADLKQLATAEEAYFVDHSAYYAGTVSAANPLFGFSPSRGVTIDVNAPAGAPIWTAVASHARSQTKCSYKLPDPIDCASPVATPSPGAAEAGDSAAVANATIIKIGDDQPVGIRPGQTQKWTFEIPYERARCLAMGQVEVLSGGDRNVNVLIMNEVAYTEWSHDQPVRTDYESNDRSVIAFDVNINDPGRYLFVVSNRSSKSASKVVQLQHVTVTCVE
jgi:hypothetical protein